MAGEHLRTTLIRWIVLSAALLATVVATVWPHGDEGTAVQVVAPVMNRNAGPSEARQQSADSALPNLGEQLERPHANSEVRDLFGARSWNPPPPPPVVQKQLPPTPPTAPPFPYGIAGSVADGNGLMVVFTKQNQDFVLRVGDVLEQTYRVDAIDAQSVALTYLPLGLAQLVPMGASK